MEGDRDHVFALQLLGRVFFLYKQEGGQGGNQIDEGRDQKGIGDDAVSDQLEGRQHHQERRDAAQHPQAPALAGYGADRFGGGYVGQQGVIKYLRAPVADLGQDEEEHAGKYIARPHEKQKRRR